MQSDSITDFYLDNNNIKINVRTDTINEPSTIVVHIHGMGSHFQATNTNEFNKHDIGKRIAILMPHIKSYAIELRGHGKSTGLKGHVNSFNEFISDLNILIDHINKIHVNIPIYLIGESMGGAVAIKYCILNKDKIKGLILLAPMCGLVEKLIPSYIAMTTMIGLSYMFPRWKYIEYKTIVDSHHNNDIYQYNDLLRLGIARECYYAMVWIDANKHKCVVPLIIFHSKTDRLTCIDTSRSFIDKCNSTNKQLVELDNSNHTVLFPVTENDIIPTRIMLRIKEWIIGINETF